MKGKKKGIVGLLFGLLSICYGQSLYFEWEYNELIQGVKQSGAYPAMAMDQTGGMHISFWDKNQDQLMYGYRTGPSGSWELEKVDPLKFNGFRSAITVDQNNLPHVVFYENNAGFSTLKYAHKTASDTWEIETLPEPPSNGWGSYLYSSTANATFFLQPRPDISISPDGTPVITNFSSWFVEGSVGCPAMVAEYDFGLYRLSPDTAGWAISRYGPVANKYPWCNDFGGVSPPFDRFGEFASLNIDDSGNEYALTHSFYNTDVLLFNTPGDTNLESSTLQVDSANSMFANPATAPTNLFQNLTWEGLNSDLGPDGALHMSYTSTINYGHNIFYPGYEFAELNNLYYARWQGDSLFMHTFFDPSITFKPTLGFTSIDVPGPAKVHITYGDRTNNYYVYTFSNDSGQTWQNDTLSDALVFCESPVSEFGGNVFVTQYDPGADRLMLHSKPVGGPTWTTTPITQNQNFGEEISTEVLDDGLDKWIYCAHYEPSGNQLYFSQSSDRENWTHAIIDNSEFQYKQVQLKLNPNQEPVVACSDNLNAIFLFHLSGGSWNKELTLNGLKSDWMDFEIDASGKYHLAYHSVEKQALIYAQKLPNDTLWVTDTLIQDTLFFEFIEHIDLELDEEAQPHISWHNATTGIMEYAHKPAMNPWVRDTIQSDESVLVGRYNSLTINQEGLPALVYVDYLNEDLYFAEKDSVGAWNYEIINEGFSENLGIPNELVFDEFNNPWIAYNYLSGYDRIRLVGRDTAGWYGVLMETEGKLGKNFTFDIVAGDFYILGKKNEGNEPGMGILFGGNGIYVERQESVHIQEKMEVMAFPNPFSSETTLKIYLPKTDYVNVKWYNHLGMTVRTETTEQLYPQGENLISLQREQLSSGLYFIEVSTKEYREVVKVFVSDH